MRSGALGASKCHCRMIRAEQMVSDYQFDHTDMTDELLRVKPLFCINLDSLREGQ